MRSDRQIERCHLYLYVSREVNIQKRFPTVTPKDYQSISHQNSSFQTEVNRSVFAPLLFLTFKIYRDTSDRYV